ncbi:MAG: hypothetical protein KC619_24280 [Myxococcales bacterium]|nr:hypothetical protein [Myxococcales bacterium]
MRSIAIERGCIAQPVVAHEVVGIARNVREGLLPINGLRIRPGGQTCGWYIWAGEEMSQADDFFVPLHVAHLDEWCPEVLPYLELPPGWRFLIAPGYEDVWFDPDLDLDSSGHE